MNLSKKTSLSGSHFIWGAIFLIMLTLASVTTVAAGDTKKPTVTIDKILKSWGATNSVSNAVYVVTGTTKDNDSVTQVYYNVNDGPWIPATTWNNWYDWSADVTLYPGKNIIGAYAEDASGNNSSVKKVKVTYYVSQPNLYYPDQATMVVSNNNEAIEFITFSEKMFSDVTGVGTYTYKRVDPLKGELSIKYIAPPSAVSSKNNVKVIMNYDVYYAGTFKDDNGQNSFILYKTLNLAPPALTDSVLTFTNHSSGVETVARFPKQPSLGSNEGQHNAPNPLNLKLVSPYPGQINDRVNVSFVQTRKLNGKIKTIRNTLDVGTVIGVNSNMVSVLFDAPYYKKSEDVFTPTGISTISYHYNTFEGGTPVITNGTGTFTYTNYTWASSVLNLQHDGLNQYLILTFTNDTSAGFFYDETHPSSGSYTTDYGYFSLALPPLITSQPQNTAAINGGSASFSVAAAGTPVLTYQWQFNGSNLVDGATGTGSTVSGSLTTNLVVDNISSSDFGNYSVVVANDIGAATSTNATLELAVPPTISAQPQNASTTVGNTVGFSVTGTGSQPLHYQWQGNGTNLQDGNNIFSSTISGSTNANLTISNVHLNDAGSYQVIITNSFGSVTSSIANLNVNLGP